MQNKRYTKQSERDREGKKSESESNVVIDEFGNCIGGDGKKREARRIIYGT